MTFREIVNDILDLASEDAGDDFETQVKVWVNRYYFALLDELDVGEDRREFSLTTVSGTSKYGMPQPVSQVLNFEDPTNDKRVPVISAREFDERYPGNTDSGEPDVAYPYGVFGVQKQPATAGLLSVESSDATDNFGHAVVVRGFSSTVDTREEVTLNGTTAVETTKSYDAGNGVERFVRKTDSGATFAGDVVLKDVDDVEIGRIPAYWDDTATYQWYEFFPIPSSAITYTVRALMHKPPLLNDEDWPDLPRDMHDLLITGPASFLLPSVGKVAAADRAGGWFTRRLNRASGRARPQHGRLRLLVDVTTMLGQMGPQGPRFDYTSPIET